MRAALLNARYEFPARRITINLAPADLPKEGGRFDLPIALGILAASGQLTNKDLDKYEFVGELALTGKLRPILGALTVALKARAHGRALLLPSANAAEAALAGDVAVYGAKHLLDVTAHLNGERLLTLQAPTVPESDDRQIPDLHDVRGQHHAKRALEIAAAGGHSLLFIGPPGAGKTMLASRLPGLLPRLTDKQAIETAAIQSLHKRFHPKHWRRRPFRAPHHTASAVALVGGGSYPRPGEISLAHHGVFIPGRTAGVRPAGAGGAARAARVRQHHDFARRAPSGVPGALPAGGGDESVPVRLSGRQRRALPLHVGERCGSTARGSRDRCSTASTCTWMCRRYRAISCWNKRRRPAKRPRPCASAWRSRGTNSMRAAASHQQRTRTAPSG